LTKTTLTEVAGLNRRFEAAPTEDVLRWAWGEFGPRAAIGTSFQGAGLVMIDLARKAGLNFPVFTLDTGLLFPETQELRKRLESFFGIEIEVLEPELSVEEQAAQHGPELWKSKPDDCCWMRKVLPLRKKLEGLDAWITGLRREQSETRQKIDLIEIYEFDPMLNRDILKLNPLANWKKESVWEYIAKNKIPYNPLRDRGYRSIGCVPCTRAVGAGEDDRAGRWTGFEKTECGIHTFLDKREGI